MLIAVAGFIILVIVVSTVISACNDIRKLGGEEEWEY